MKIALVTGSTGKIGRILVPELLRQKFRVRLFLRDRAVNINSIVSSFIVPADVSLSRPLTVSAIMHTDVEIFFGDITDYPSVVAAVSGVDYIFHLAALLHINNPSPSMYGKYYDVNVIGTKNIVDAALKSGVQRVILFSTISVYGSGSPDYPDSDRQIFYESSSLNPLTIYATTKLLAEQNCSSCVTILRLASVYGTRVAGNYLRLIQSVRRGFFCMPVNDKGFSIYRTLIHENDVVSGAILASTHPAAAGKTYNLTDGEFHSLEDIVKAIADALSVNVRIFRIPQKPLRRLSDLIHRYNKMHRANRQTTQPNNDKPTYINKLIRNPAHNIEKALSIIDKLMENIAVDGKKIQNELGFKPQYNLQSGWRNALDEQHSNLKYKFNF